MSKIYFKRILEDGTYRLTETSDKRLLENLYFWEPLVALVTNFTITWTKVGSASGVIPFLWQAEG